MKVKVLGTAESVNTTERWHGSCYLLWYVCVYHTLLYLYTISIFILYIHYTICNIYNVFPYMSAHPLMYLYAPVHPQYIYVPPIQLYVPAHHIHAYTPHQYPPKSLYHPYVCTPLYICISCITVGLSYSCSALLLVTYCVLCYLLVAPHNGNTSKMLYTI